MCPFSPARRGDGRPRAGQANGHRVFDPNASLVGCLVQTLASCRVSGMSAWSAFSSQEPGYKLSSLGPGVI